MLGIVFAILSSGSKGLEKIAHRYVLANEDSVSYAFVWNLLSSLLFLPLFILEFNLPQEPWTWSLVLISSTLWALVSYFGFKAYSSLEVSLKEPIGKSKIFFVLFLSVLFLRESLTVEKVIGTLLIFGGVILVTYHQRKRFGSFRDKGVIYTLISAFLSAVVLLVDKYGMMFFKPEMYSFLVYFIPAVILFPLVIRKKLELKSIVQQRFGATIMAVVLGSSYYLIFDFLA
ncbi:TPA: EamA family transporter, partial [Candidatus Woesearchaeota archaeon]|nr:EamA family transporter [Candidatus Woesearchaeota archaeon]